MRRAALITGALAASALAAGAAGAGGGTESVRYEIEFDNAFGLVEGGDLKVAGVRAGVLEKIRLDRSSLRAIATIRIDQDGFGSLRDDARCEIRPQSLLGEYFVDCLPGRSSRELPRGSRIAVEQTASTIPPDLVTSLMRLPYRERLRIVINELGAAAAGNGENLNAAVRRAVPAFRETQRVLASLAADRRELGALIRDADTVLTALARSRRDAGRFVANTSRTVAVSGRRSSEVARSLAALPGFLAELQPALASLETIATRGAPAVAKLSSSAPDLERLLDGLPPLADALRPGLKAVGRAAEEAEAPLRRAAPLAQELEGAVAGTPELLRNGRIILRHLDDRGKAAEADPRSPDGNGFTGLEGLLQFIHTLNTLTNAFDGEVHLLKAALSLTSTCQDYRSAEQVKADPKLIDNCASILGPNQPGVTTPDPTEPRKAPARSRDGRQRAERRDRTPEIVTRAVEGTVAPDREAGTSLLDFLLGR